MIKSLLTISLITALNLSLSACGAMDQDYETYIHQGEAFKHLSLTDIKNQSYDLYGIKSKKLVIFFATWCSDSLRMFEQLKASPLATDNTVTIIAIGRDETNASLTQFAEDYHVTFPLVSDEQRIIYSQYANKGVPRLILLDENNRVVNTLIGETDNIIEQVKWN
ncbi:TlpA family protein disulfide reductase [Pseudoalteromonas luteoviolacea]|uniref:Redoxin domain-containing protein n=1 Tax=Pseudoalteromonas luteoviolacea S4054 TaxID=1129367 RepID=A0A0F6AHQ6_9GAMM|nr:TlpA disulfide reductase family protein [Pseudoalteromonas luteoviolacea]AOT10007.1 hypothetical protein S4054249_20275 [Pseudoalteromonas luteoviolacea]AOT14918.1 hypothetical protein S40542_20245 [Pseudoalteromonas luteoviolacea]AOT19834.1 hypothetical protein S4054_20250 [Pseudoalteromonas luteoviolacea]KKE84914.1 hypothetical protein N479_07400 [Pseudoalteromonas luteoviolacea S4054]KZN72531.1 hypothetical protein N481_14990 [Pseudoalteromonas luteoviolacea S4047-1]